MDLWQWLMANPLAVGAIVGAGGSVAAQLVGALVASHSANKRADQDREDRALDRAAAERERFDAARRESFVEVLQRSSAIGVELTTLPDSRQLAQIEADLEQLAQRVEVVGLLAPTAYPACVETHHHLAVARERLASGEMLDAPNAWWRDLREQFVEPMRAAMREALEPARTSVPKRRWFAGRGSTGVLGGLACALSAHLHLYLVSIRRQDNLAERRD